MQTLRNLIVSASILVSGGAGIPLPPRGPPGSHQSPLCPPQVMGLSQIMGRLIQIMVTQSNLDTIIELSARDPITGAPAVAETPVLSCSASRWPGAFG